MRELPIGVVLGLEINIRPSRGHPIPEAVVAILMLRTIDGRGPDTLRPLEGARLVVAPEGIPKDIQTHRARIKIVQYQDGLGLSCQRDTQQAQHTQTEN